MVNMHNLDWIVPETDNCTFKNLALEARCTKNKDLLFSSLEMGASDNKVHMITTKDMLSEATAWIAAFEDKMKKIGVEAFTWIPLTGGSYPPHRIDKPTISDAHSAYAN